MDIISTVSFACLQEVAFSLDGIDLGKYFANTDREVPTVYDCYAISNHYGGTDSGHYTAFVRSLANGKWYELNYKS
jgi:ubiquitin carboxyl-terminal hydrolase 4/11/15